MQSGSQPNPSEEPPPLYTMANLIGTVIALITLASPVYIIQHFSASAMPTDPSQAAIPAKAVGGPIVE